METITTPTDEIKVENKGKRTKTFPPNYNGVVARNSIVRREEAKGLGDYEYGHIALRHGMAEKTILLVLKDIYPCLYEKTHLSRLADESMSPASILGMLSPQRIGSSVS